MRIGPQLYGFQGLDIRRFTTAAVSKTALYQISMLSSETSTTGNTSALDNNTSATVANISQNNLAVALPDPQLRTGINVPNDPGNLTKAQVTGLISKRLMDNLLVNTSPSIEQLLRINLSLFQSNLDLEG